MFHIKCRAIKLGHLIDYYQAKSLASLIKLTDKTNLAILQGNTAGNIFVTA
jgi:hypothetical protein